MPFAHTEKGEPMRGLLNNDEAVKVLENLIGTERNRIHQIYNLGYRKGYVDGTVETMGKLTDMISDDILGRRADE